MSNRILKLKKKDVIRFLFKLLEVADGLSRYTVRKALDNIEFYGYYDGYMSVKIKDKRVGFNIYKDSGIQYKIEMLRLP